MTVSLRTRLKGRWRWSFSDQGSLVQALQLSALASLATGAIFIWQASGKGSILGFFSGSILLRALLFVGISLAAGLASKLPGIAGTNHILTDDGSFSTQSKRLRLWDWLIVLALLTAILYVFFASTFFDRLDLVIPKIWVVFQFILVEGILVEAALARRTSYLESLGAAAILCGVLIRVISYLPQISMYPFSLDWSEGSNLYYASTFFAPQIYGVHTPLAVLTPSRAILQSLPFLFPTLPIWTSRLWQILLWVGMTLAGAFGVAHRLSFQGRVQKIFFVAWAFLFLFQGPIYYNLMLCGVLVLFGYNRHRFWQSLLVVLTASIWAGVSRVNWFPLPGILAAVLYLIETPRGQKSLLRYMLPPLGWIASGLVVAAAAQLAYIGISGDDPLFFASGFTAPLLWDRLFPGATYATGVLLGLAIAIFPLAWLIGGKLHRSLQSWNPWRLVGLGVVLAILLAGGLVVSVRIGGGNNLHNLDAFLLVSALVGSAIFYDRLLPDHPEKMKTYQLPNLVWACLLVLPFVQTISTPAKLAWPDTSAGMQEVQQLQAVIDQYRGQPGEILFMDDRQLLTFHTINGVPLVTEDDKVILMEAAMANNAGYLKQFRNDLAQHRFSLIISETVKPILQDELHGFSSENNAWVTQVASPILQYYQPVASFENAGIEALAPKP